jgi:N-acetylmuramoyl-L-alanine amidase
MDRDVDGQVRSVSASERWLAGPRPHRIRAALIALACGAAMTVAPMVVSTPVLDASPHHPDRFDRVVIDAGHGGEDDGARGKKGLTEKDVVLDIARRVARALRSKGIDVVLTRDDDTFVPLEERTSRANDSRADLFVSIHANSATRAEPSGVETYFVSLDASDADAAELAARENEAFGEEARKAIIDDPLTQLLGDMIVNEYVRESSEFAKLVQHQLVELDGARSRGVKQAPFVVLMGVQMPAALIEVGFISNPTEEKKMRQSAHRSMLADAIVAAIGAFGERADARRGVDQAASLFGPPSSIPSVAAPGAR